MTSATAFTVQSALEGLRRREHDQKHTCELLLQPGCQSYTLAQVGVIWRHALTVPAVCTEHQLTFTVQISHDPARPPDIGKALFRLIWHAT
jgi:hypothetical protein